MGACKKTAAANPALEYIHEMSENATGFAEVAPGKKKKRQILPLFRGPELHFLYSRLTQESASARGTCMSTFPVLCTMVAPDVVHLFCSYIVKSWSILLQGCVHLAPLARCINFCDNVLQLLGNSEAGSDNKTRKDFLIN